MDNSGKTLAALIVGLVAGALVGLTLAPNKGKKTRSKINESANDAFYDLEDMWEEGAGRIKDLAETAIEELEKYSKKLTKNM